MKKFLVAGAFIAALLSAPAFAADMPVKAPAYVAPAPAPMFNWSGCYLGADVGYGWGRDKLLETNAAGVPTGLLQSTADVDGGKYGGYLGCNYQAAGSPWVWGIEGDFEGTSMKGSRHFLAPFTADFDETKIRWESSVRGRIGYAWDRSLLYATGGVAFADIKAHYHSALGGDISNTHNRTGWTVGAGWDYAFTQNWIGRLEYRYADFGKFTDFAPNFVTFQHHKVTENVIRVGIAYKW